MFGSFEIHLAKNRFSTKRNSGAPLCSPRYAENGESNHVVIW